MKTNALGWFKEVWWVAVFSGVALLSFGQAMKSRSAAIAELRFRLTEMEKLSLLAAQEREELALQLASHSDPAWIELILLREVGVVPEGFLKVHFKK
jgi:hypothetical protein